MEELEKVLEALSIVERYDEYLYRRNWGRLLIVIGAVIPLGALINTNTIDFTAQATANEGTFLLVGYVLTIAISLGFLLYTVSGFRNIVRSRSLGEPSGSRFRSMSPVIWAVALALVIVTISLPLLFISESPIYGYAAVLTCSVGLVLVGISVNRMASGMLRHSG